MASPVQEAYDRLAPSYDRRWGWYTEATLRAALEGLDPPANALVLDLASGTGELSRRLLRQRPDLTVVGLDLSHPMLVQGLGKPMPGTYLPLQADAAQFPLPDARFDLVVCANSVHHFEALEQTLAETRRVLRPGGRLSVTDWCDDYLSCKLCSLYLRLFDRSFVRTYPLNACRQHLEAAGFTIEHARRFKIDWLWGLMRFDAVRSSEQ